MTDTPETKIRITCPCCGAVLSVDARAAAVTEWTEPQDPRKAAALRDAERVLREEKEAVEARYKDIVKADKERGATMDRKFQEFLEKSQGQPSAKPLRDIDLD